MPIFTPDAIGLNIVNEAYYGKKKEFKEIEQLLAIIIQRCHNIKNGYDYDIEINGSTELTRIEKLFEKAFGMAEMHLTFYNLSLFGTINGIVTPNAFTMPSFLTYFKKKRRIESLDALVCNVWVDVALIVECDMSVGELMSIILHELGHCYNASLFALLAKIPIVMTGSLKNGELDSIDIDVEQTVLNLITGSVFGILGVYTLFNKIDKLINSAAEKNDTISKLIYIIKYIITNYRRLTSIVNPAFLTFLSKPGIAMYYMLQPRTWFGYSDEKFADSFATAYGYGPEVISMQKKFQDHKHVAASDVIEKIPILNVGVDFIDCCNMAAIAMIDEHPNAAIRMQSQINKCKRDLKDPNLDPRIRKELMDNLTEMEQLGKDVQTLDHDTLMRGKIFTVAYNKIMMSVFKGKFDLREIFEIVYRHEV